MRAIDSQSFGNKSGPTVAIVGGGFGGLAAAINLKKRGIETFTLFERADGPGGVWWANRYPGAEVDTESHVYSFSFKPYAWKRSHAAQAEILEYIYEAIDEYNLLSHYRFGTAVRRIEWDQDTAQYEVITDFGSDRFDFVISAVGFLSEPSIPKWPGMEDFSGQIIHTAAWREISDLKSKAVAVVGTGSSAVQVVSTLAGRADKLLVFQRDPHWVEPKPVHEYSAKERESNRRPWSYRIKRWKGLLRDDRSRRGGKIHTPGTAQNEAGRQRCLEFIDRELADHPKLKGALTPNYPYYAKRPVKEGRFYAALRQPSVQLIPHAVERLENKSIIDATGTRHHADVVILATGFRAADYLSSMDVVGESGRELKAFWNGDPQALIGISVPEFPNFFMLYGPNSNGPLILFMLERQAEIISTLIKNAAKRGHNVIAVKPSAFTKYNRWLDRRLKTSVWHSVNSYYQSSSGRIVTEFPDGPFKYSLMAEAFKYVGWTSYSNNRGSATSAQQAQAAE